ncbi:hypothetical protein ACFV23_54675, partial [Streptomyces sp. NPDC059627]
MTGGLVAMGVNNGNVTVAADLPGSGRHQRLRKTADELAANFHTQWNREWVTRHLHYPGLLPVRFRPVDGLQDQWANIRMNRMGEDGGPLALDGRIERIAEVYRTIESGRLVVLGKAGSGKSCLTLAFARARLEERRKAPNGPEGTPSGRSVPVIFGLASWNPEVALEDWLAQRLIELEPGLAEPMDGTSEAGVLLSSHDRLVLPVLDGFDEMAPGLHAKALVALRDSGIPFLLTSRREEYEKAVVESGPLAQAAVVELQDLTLAELAHYLPRSAPAAGAARTGDGVWDKVLDHMRAGRAETLRAVLSVPLMAAMAREIYSEPPGSDPWELVGFDHQEDLESHLLSAYLPAVYGRRRTPGRSRRWNAERAEKWLGGLAERLEEQGTYDLAWWRLGDSLPGGVRVRLGHWAAGISALLAGTAVTGPFISSAHPFIQVCAAGTVLLGAAASARAGQIAFGAEPGPAPARVRVQIRGVRNRPAAWAAEARRAMPGRVLQGPIAVGLVAGWRTGWWTGLPDGGV